MLVDASARECLSGEPATSAPRACSPISRGHAAKAGCSPLDLDRGAHGIYYARKLGQEAVAAVLYDPASVLGNLRLDQFLKVRLSRSCVPSSSSPI
jgi:hypothetical protein